MGLGKYLGADETDGGPAGADARVEDAVDEAIGLHTPEKRSAFWRERIEAAAAKTAVSLGNSRSASELELELDAACPSQRSPEQNEPKMHGFG